MSVTILYTSSAEIAVQNKPSQNQQAVTEQAALNPMTTAPRDDHKPNESEQEKEPDRQAVPQRHPLP